MRLFTRANFSVSAMSLSAALHAVFMAQFARRLDIARRRPTGDGARSPASLKAHVGPIWRVAARKNPATPMQTRSEVKLTHHCDRRRPVGRYT